MLTASILAAVCAASLGSVPAARVKPWKLDRILVTFWCPPPATDANLATVAREGYNLTWTPPEGLDVAQRHGLKAMLQDPLLAPATLDDAAQRARLDALIEKVKNHPAMEAYFITDEPSAAAFPGLGKLVAYLREKDPAHFAYINLFPTYASNEQLGTKGDVEAAYREHLRQFIDVVKPALLSYDHYHFFKTGDGAQYFLNLGMIRKAALDAHIPFLNIVQACTIEKVWRLVNAHELRWLTYTTLAYGARGISYFLYWGPKEYGGLYQDGEKTPLADSVAELAHEVDALSPALMKLQTLGVYHAGPIPLGAEAVPADCPVQFDEDGEFVLGLFGSGGAPSAFMVVNRRYDQPADARLRLPQTAQRAEEFDRASKRWTPVAMEDGILKAHLAPGDGRLYRWR